MEPQYVHVTLGQFESTAIEKLVARGIREDVARAFVTEGLRKQDGYNRYKEIVCKAKFHSFFIHEPTKGAMVPTVLERKTNKFKAPFAMSGKEKADLISSFPELDVICDGTIRNSHSFYANKRLAECELLISMVWATAAGDASLNPRSVVDVGGNQTQHINRGRHNVHCDTPVLSAKDIYRYTVREVYSGVNTGEACKQTFHSCMHRADFGIGIHSTYDLSPQSLANGMERRGMKWFFGVVNVHPALSSLSTGEYIHDGIVLKVSSDSVNYGFIHDTSLVYTHSKYTMSQYLISQLSLPVKTPQGTKYYQFKHHSVRGATIVFTISEVDGPVESGTSIATGLRYGKYRLSMSGVLEPIEVDAEMFDRLVLMAAASRKIEEYNITALFKYAKSLRQRISINSIVLSSGFKEDTTTLVRITVAAMAVASAYHFESARFFQKASKQIMWRRSKSYVEDFFNVSGALVTSVVDSLSNAVGATSVFQGLKEWCNDILKQGNSVKVEVATVKDFGGRFRSSVLGPVHAQLGAPNLLEWFSYKPRPLSDAGFDFSHMSFLSIDNSNLTIHNHYSPVFLAGYGYRSSFPSELEVAGILSGPHRLVGISNMRLACTASRDVVYRSYLNQFPPPGECDKRIRHLQNGDSLVHVVTNDPSDPSIEMQHCFIAFRGIGSKVFICKPPAFYSSRCLAFVVFFEEDITEMVHVGACGQYDTEDLPNPLYSVVRSCISHLQYASQEQGFLVTDESGNVKGEYLARSHLSGRAGVGTRVELVTTARSDRATELEKATSFLDSVDVFSSSDVEATAQEEGSVVHDDGDSDLDDVLGEAVDTMGNISVGSGDDHASLYKYRPGTKSEVQTGTQPMWELGDTGRSVRSAPHVSVSIPRVSVVEPTPVEEHPTDEVVSVTDTTSADQFAAALRRLPEPPTRRHWGSESSSSSTSGPGFSAIAELLRWAEESSSFALSVGQRYINLAKTAVTEDLPAKDWHAIRSGLEGDVQICAIDSSGQLVEWYSKSSLDHMAVTDGDQIYVVKALAPDSGPFITYRELEVWTVSSIIAIASRCMFSDYSCDVELIQGPAGCGKTTEICNAITERDLGLCETREAAADTRERLALKSQVIANEFGTVDSFLINRAVRPVRSPEVLYIDECLRLHAGKIWCLIKVLRPGRVVCYGDPKQIPLLPFTPGFEFKYSKFPWTSVSTLKRTFRLPADITMMLVESGYYDYAFKTHNPILHGFKGVKQFYQGIFNDKPKGAVVLTYTKAAADDLRLQGVSPVMTIGQSQGKDIDDVWLYRESDLAKDIYYNREQTLTAITRVKRSFTFVTISPSDDSEIHTLLDILNDPVKSALVSDYLA